MRYITFTYLLLLVTNLNGQQPLSYQGEIIGNSSNKDYHIIRNGNKLFTTKLLIGDTIIVNSSISEIKILVDKFAKIDTLNDKTLFISHNDSSKEKSIVAIVLQEIKDFFSPYKHTPVPVRSSRGNVDSGSEESIKDMLGNQRITMLSGFDFNLKYFYSDIKSVNLNDEDGKIILSLSGNDSIMISLSKVYLEADSKYDLIIENSDDEIYKVELNKLDIKTERNILNDLAELNSLSQTDIQRLINYATYFQLLTDQSKENIYMYWLSYQMLNQIEPMDDNITSTIKFNLLNRYKYYLEEYNY